LADHNFVCFRLNLICFDKVTFWLEGAGAWNIPGLDQGVCA
jgi:hypothetical protein